jgi:hypothetical protein
LAVKQPLAIQTRWANDIENEFNPTPPHARDSNICEKHRADFPAAIPRTSDPTYGYNCHGLTFAARRTQVWSSTHVQHILTEDGYTEIALKDVLAGDVAIYRSTETSEIEHSAIVVEKPKTDDLKGPLVVSKWGPCPEFIHFYMECPYRPSTVTFYRLRK